MSEPTQVRHPMRATIRSAFAFLVGLAALLPVIVAAAGTTVSALPYVGAALAVAAVVTRIMAIPAVNDFLERYVSPLGARGHREL